ncbi:hypothetical protein [Flavobacterium cerinum]|uniref:DUF4870 domain-containing protein n=1 Tax=Flavobacterium cerinum TaxID=2502784 RepID=A0ABY5IM29_9FLAO|nr:hypothetical protein [Flavobacterium cerinum]UUC43891.1 hypothetical protein NOX80_09620 [Flavobacterium cerinum]
MKNNADQSRTVAIISYLTIIGTIIALTMNMESKTRFAGFHIRQALGINLTFYVLAYFVGYADSWMVSSAFFIFFFVLWAYSLVGAIQNDMKTTPILGEYFQKWFKNLA